MKDNTILLAHYYAPIEIQERAHEVGDSFDLAQKAQKADAERIVFAGVQFMAETAKVLNPNAEVILPDAGSSCSLVDQTDVGRLKAWIRYHEAHTHKPVQHVAYINSSARHKKTADWIVTSRNVEEIIGHLIDEGNRVIFSPDRNMGAYLKYQHPEWDLHYWEAVCVVHDAFKEDELDLAFRTWSDGPKFLIAHPESPLPILKRADFVGSTRQMLDWIKNRPRTKAVQHVFVATEVEMLEIMRQERPDLVIAQAPAYTGCQCHACPFMKKNTMEAVDNAINGKGGLVIDYLTAEDMEKVRVPIKRMLSFQG